MPALHDLLSDLSAELRGDDAVMVTRVVYDSRQATPGCLFVALRGTHTDGHRYLADATSRGAVAAVVEEWPTEEIPGLRAIARVTDTRVALAAIAARFYGYPASDLGLIGVTGTDGKTTTTFLIDAILRAAGYRTGLIGTVALRIGDEFVTHDLRQTTPESLDVQALLARMRATGAAWAVVEATSHGLELHRLDHCPFDIAVVTNVTQEHLDFHGTIENYRRAKGRLLEFVRDRPERAYPRGIVLNADDEGARSLARFAGSVPILWYSGTGKAALAAENARITGKGTSFCLRYGDRVADVHLRLFGLWNVENALAAAGTGILLGIPLDVVVTGLQQLSGVPGRFTPIDCGQPFRVIVDYAHTPKSFERVLPLARSLAQRRVIVVFGSAGERDRIKRRLQGAIAARLADFAVFTSEDPRHEDPDAIIAEIAEGAREAGAQEGEQFVCVEDRALAIREAFRRARPGDIVLLLGKGHEQCILYGDERRPWNEEAEARQALRELGYDCSS